MDIVVVGSCMTDLVSYVPRLPAPGETLHGHRFVVGFGGKGANQCIMAARLGACTAMVAKVGEDTFGHNYLKNFKENGVNTDHVKQTAEALTGTAPIAVDDNGQNSIIIVAGANLLLSEDDVQNAEGLIKSAKVLICQLEVKPETSLAAMRLAKKHGVTVIFNPAPGQAKLDSDMYALTDYFCPNETEAEILTGLPVNCIEDARKVIAVLLSYGCKCVIITMGSQGAVYGTKNDNNYVHIPAGVVTPRDTTGAGDAFIGALAFNIASHSKLSLQEMIRRAGEIATISVQAPGTQTSFPYRNDLPEELFQ